MPQQLIELAMFVGPERSDGYTETLENFGYGKPGLPVSRGLAATYLRQRSSRLWLGGSASYEQSPEWRRTDSDTSLATDWSTIRAMAVVRGVQMASDHGFSSHVGVYGQLGGGLALGRSHFKDADDMWSTNTDFGIAVAASAGLLIRSTVIDRLIGTFGYEFAYTPSITNDIGDRHASGGHRLTLAFGVTF